jgi:hypothetical protein
MSCTGKCPITRYEVEYDVLQKEESSGCSNVDTDDAIDKHMKAAFPDAQQACEQQACEDSSCLCLELPNQTPTPSKWSPLYFRRVQFTIPDTDCELFYEAKYKYRTRLYDANCARGPIPDGQ